MFDLDPARNPHQDLWCAVLLTQIEDATLGVYGTAERLIDSRRATIEAARRYLTTPSKDLATVCHLAGLDPEAVIHRMRRRIAEAPSADELARTPRVNAGSAFGRPKKASTPRAPLKTITHNGETLAVREWAERTGLSIATIYSRLRYGWTIEDALTLPKGESPSYAVERKQVALDVSRSKLLTWKRGSPEKIVVHAGMGLTIKQWAERTGLRPNTIKRRLAQGLPVEQALDPKDQRRKS